MTTPAERIGDTRSACAGIRCCRRGFGRGNGWRNAAHTRHHRRVCKDAEAVRQAYRNVSGGAAPVRGHVPGDGKRALGGVLRGVGARRERARRAVAVSIAKMYASDACRAVGNRGIQIHGGMGFTWENDLHLYYRRAKASETTLGDSTFHRERIARMVIDAGAASVQGA